MRMDGRDAHAMRRVALHFCLAILACALSPGAAAQAIDRAHDLARAAREAASARVPLLVFFSQPGCPYCDEARRDYLAPMNNDPKARATQRMVEVDITSESPLIDFSGRSTTHRGFAQAERIRLVPVIIFVDARGAPLAPALIGLTVADFYQTMLERRIEQARAQLATGTR